MLINNPEYDIWPVAENFAIGRFVIYQEALQKVGCTVDSIDLIALEMIKYFKNYVRR
ncbi:hypothetical protein Calkr_2401 [Caldicellulosiruptor acetigenus I77R1B]|uniref:Uncharacterized protein n=1 Tax=Caldicellulosiruptor acetigenus (strain ATCC 700853 / DSM 12137 / I77R1B) TaxID=632335 RepID=E4S7F5_CALA7|nr:hypothetical protein [Caldicellulosiruptor acetigenus]ADQ41838.1 hypothetical protein Calkr_2401 [Caldicellulosiruptor acetigenus I77R1B]